ncbi:unnamed protein product [Lactuca virosa]|uniref:TPX2 C-terminal domain-containing protein n=1 Tax=Lactuca virosa TaxID=75947 RepID=A0AAU9N140_9ASTR|nr:unnamed protein product [Lactuca virosa]
MGESMVEAQNIENKMRESVASRETLGVSVSFDEVGKCSTPGSVAQKKAFFEAHYKKIAAMKAEAEAEAELLNQQKARETGPSRSDDYPQDNFEDTKKEQEEGIESKPCENDEELQVEISTMEGSENFQDANHEEVSSVKDESFEEVSMIVLNNSRDNPEEAILVKDETFQDESEHLLQSQTPIVLNVNGDKLDEAVLVNDESMKLVKQHFKVDLEDPKESKQETPKPKAKKVNPTKLEMKKKPTSIIPKSPETSSTRLLKPKATPTPMASTRSSSSKKANATSSSSLKKTNATSSSSSKSIRTAPMSLHLSMSMNSVTSDTASSSVASSRRRSLFMEQMGDKDIVRRAFKTFQNRINELPNEIKQISIKETESKASTSMASQKENERSRKAAEKINPARGKLEQTWKSESLGKKATSSSSVVLRSNERAERRKEFFKNLEQKSNAREAERTQKLIQNQRK